MLVDKKQIKLTIGGEVIETGDGFPWILRHIANETFMTPSAPVTQLASRDGGVFGERRFVQREPVIYLDAADRSKSRINADWLYLKSVLNAKQDAELALTSHGVTRYLYGAVTDVRKRDEDGMRWDAPADVRFVFTAPDPYYLGPEIELDFKYELPLLDFPLTFWYDGGTTVGLLVSGNTLEFEVSGDDPPGFTLTLTATGDVVNPQLTNADGGFVRAECTMHAGDVLVIRYGMKGELRLNGLWCSRSLTSRFFPLKIGVNILTLSADSGVDLLNGKLKYRGRYQ